MMSRLVQKATNPRREDRLKRQDMLFNGILSKANRARTILTVDPFNRHTGWRTRWRPRRCPHVERCSERPSGGADQCHTAWHQRQYVMSEQGTSVRQRISMLMHKLYARQNAKRNGLKASSGVIFRFWVHL